MSENNNYNHPSEENPEKFSNIEVSKPETYAAGTKAVLVYQRNKQATNAQMAH